MADKAILYDAGRCSGCGSCTWACSDALALGVREGGSPRTSAQGGEGLSGTCAVAVTFDERERANGRVVFEYDRNACVHCADPACAKACPTSAVKADADTGFVGVDRDRCVSCGMCALACPFGVPQMNEESNRVVKCDGCLDAVKAGGQPACTTVCPTGALAFGDRSAIIEEAQRRVAALKDRGYDRADALGTGGNDYHVVTVLRHGAQGSRHERLAATGMDPAVMIRGAVGPASAVVLGAMAAGGVAAYVSERKKDS